MKFQTLINVEDYNLDKSGNALITWELELECREWGIKSFIITVPDQTIVATVEETDANGNEMDVQITYEIKNVSVVCPVQFDDILTPSELYIKKDIIRLDF